MHKIDAKSIKKMNYCPLHKKSFVKTHIRIK
jgi:hypothetical protein